MTATLITVPFSHFCEKARWALDWSDVVYREEPHLPMLHWAATFRAGGGRTVPVLVTDDASVLADSTAILRWADDARGDGARLYPDDPRLRAEVEALEDEFDEHLGPAARTVGYHYAFGDSRIIVEMARRAAAGWEFQVTRAALPLVRGLMLRLMRIDAQSVARSLDRVRGIFDAVGERLVHGRPYLVGDHFSAADLTFAALGGPLVEPPQHPFPLPTELFPDVLHRLRDEMRAQPAGAFILRMYAQQRTAPPATDGAATTQYPSRS